MLKHIQTIKMCVKYVHIFALEEALNFYRMYLVHTFIEVLFSLLLCCKLTEYESYTS